MAQRALFKFFFEQSTAEKLFWAKRKQIFSAIIRLQRQNNTVLHGRQADVYKISLWIARAKRPIAANILQENRRVLSNG